MNLHILAGLYLTLTLSDGDGTAVDITSPTGVVLVVDMEVLLQMYSSATSGTVVLYAIQNSGNAQGSSLGILLRVELHLV